VAGIENVIAELGADLEIDLEDLLERDDLPVRDELGTGALLGQAGTGGGDLTNLSVRMGSRQGHVLEDVGHSIFANCFRQNAYKDQLAASYQWLKYNWYNGLEFHRLPAAAPKSNKWGCSAARGGVNLSGAYLVKSWWPVLSHSRIPPSK
jgi:hypothetical protein